jgi:hypothetical protein
VQQPGRSARSTTDDDCRDAWCGPFAETVVPGLREDYPPYVRLEEEGRALRSLQLAGVGLRVRRQQYVPPSGAFARTLTTLRNTSDDPMTLVSPRACRRSTQPQQDLRPRRSVQSRQTSPALLALVTGSRLPAVRGFRPPVDLGERLV